MICELEAQYMTDHIALLTEIRDILKAKFGKGIPYPIGAFELCERYREQHGKLPTVDEAILRSSEEVAKLRVGFIQ